MFFSLDQFRYYFMSARLGALFAFIRLKYQVLAVYALIFHRRLINILLIAFI